MIQYIVAPAYTVLKNVIEVFMPNLGTRAATETELKGKYGRAIKIRVLIHSCVSVLECNFATT